MATFLVEDYSFPLVSVTGPNEALSITGMYGTATHLNNGIFITAAHSIKNASEHEKFGLSFLTDLRDSATGIHNSQTHFVSDYELFEDYDLGLIRLSEPNTRALSYKWDASPGLMFENVMAIGFPHAHDAPNKFYATRGLKGHIVCQNIFFRFKSNPKIYELSFHCPRGISGAALADTIDIPKVKGYIIGNEANEIMVFSEREIDEASGEKTVFEKYETTKFGIAIQVSNILPLSSRILGGTFEEYLKREGLLE